jgi:hypothetical protein
MTTPTQREQRKSFILRSQSLPSLRNGLYKVVEEEEDKIDENDYVDDEKECEDKINDSSKEEEEEEEGENDEYEKDFVDDETEDSEDSRATFFHSAVKSDNDSNEEAEETENEDATLSVVEELENLGIRSDGSNN